MQRVFLLILLFFTFYATFVSQAREEQFGLRMIAVRTETEAASLRAQIEAGTAFEELAKDHSIDSSASSGGFIGLFRLADLRPELQRALEGVAAGQISAVTPAGGQYLLLQRLTVEEADWIGSYNAGIEAFEKARYEEAARNFLQALPQAEKLTPVDYRLEDNLHGLAEAYRLQKKPAEAEPYYRRYLALHWGGPSAPEVLDRFSALLALAYFEDSQLVEGRRKFQEALDRGPLSEELYHAMSATLFKGQLLTEAETLMGRAVQLFPTSKDVRYRLAQIYRDSFKARKALEVFEQLSRMKAQAGIDLALDRLQQSVAYQRIGSVHAELVEFDEAAAAYKKALEFTPDSTEARLGLGDVYLQQGRTDDALTEYNRVVATDTKSAEAHFRVADANLRMGRFEQAAAAAAKVLAIDISHRRAHYVRATALLRMGQAEDGQNQLELFRKLEADARAETDRSRDIVVANRGAAAKLVEDRSDEAIEMFLKAVETYPDSPTPYLNLGLAQSKLGHHKAAIDTFQKMLSLGMTDGFLVYWNLAQEYKVVGDAETSRRHEVVYLQNLDVALREALEWKIE
jgi:tetratricopeptide (TPR) repeat protein